ncbi:MAG: signal peptidase II [Mariprofundales bacterium]
MRGVERWHWQILLAGLLLFIDQISKWWIEQPDFLPFVIIDGWINIVRAHNPGVAFSMFDNLPDAFRANLLVFVTAIIALFLAIWWWRVRQQPHLMLCWGLLLVLCGAVGNIIDRMRFGYVVDFLDVYVRTANNEYHWPAFNVADSCICIGVILLIIDSFVRKDYETTPTNNINNAV